MQKIGKNKGILRKKNVIVMAVALAIGIPVAIFATQQNTVIKQHASQFNDLNTSYAVTQTTNPDGTMGPADYTGNISNTFPQVYLGTLDFLVTDPPQAPQNRGNGNGVGNPYYQPTSLPTHVLPTQAQGYSNQGQVNKPTVTQPTHAQNTSGAATANTNSGGPQPVISLLLTVTKVEVHLAHVGLPGAKNEAFPKPSPGKPSGTPGHGTNQEVNKWETLNCPYPQTLDLVQLANSHISTLLGSTKLVNGRYTEVRLYVSSASAVLPNGTKVDLVIPGKSNIVRVVHPFVIDSSKTTTLTMDFDAQNSVIQAGNQYLLKPVVAKMLDNAK